MVSVMNPFKQDEIVILIGAGASVQAKMPDSSTMIRKVEDLIENDGNWSKFRQLYNYIKSSIYFSDGIKGEFENRVLFNIERLVNTLEELKKKDEHPLYPFVGAWNPKLVEIGGENFKEVEALRNDIVGKLRKDWIELTRIEDASYYNGLVNFQRQYEYPLRVFSLNYDLCIEKICIEASIERGFNQNRKWDWRLFEDIGNETKMIYLYKLHGSTDWKYGDDNVLTYLDSTSAINSDEVTIIYGTSYKLQYLDPFLFFAYQFRKWTLDDSRLIIAIGYGFGDEHINGIIGQALNNNKGRKLLSIAPLSEGNTLEKKQKDIERILMVRNEKNQVVCWDMGAREFMENNFTIKKMAELFPEEADLILEISE